MPDAEHFMKTAIALARENVLGGGRPFGAVLVMNGEIVSTGVNQVVATKDPTAHAELLAVRAAAITLGRATLRGAKVYASGHPCPMCLAAMRLAGISDIAYAYSNEDGAPHGLTSAALYAELRKPFLEQDMKFVYQPVRPEGEDDIYDVWSERGNG